MSLPKVGNTELPGEVVASTNTQVGESTSIIEPRQKWARSTQHSYSCVAKELKSGKSMNDIL